MAKTSHLNNLIFKKGKYMNKVYRVLPQFFGINASSSQTTNTEDNSLQSFQEDSGSIQNHALGSAKSLAGQTIVHNQIEHSSKIRSNKSDNNDIEGSSPTMKVQLKNQKLETLKCDVLIVNLFEGVKIPGGGTGAVDLALDGLLKKIIKEEDFKGKLGSTLTLRTNDAIPAKKVIVVGLGEKEKFDLDAVRKATAGAIRAASRENAKTVCTILHGAGIGKLDPKDAAQAIQRFHNLRFMNLTNISQRKRTKQKIKFKI